MGTTTLRRRFAAVVLGALIGSALVTNDVRVAVAADDGNLRFEAHSTYTVDPTARVIRVSVDLIATNNQPDSNDGFTITQYYYDELFVGMIAGASNLRAVRDGREQGVRIEPSENGEFAFAAIDLSPNLYYRDTARVQFTYDLPSQPPRSDATTRVNNAYATFWAFPVADPNLTSVRIRIPKGFEVELIGSDLEESSAGQYTLWESGSISDPETWGVIVSARDDRRLDKTRFKSGKHTVVIRGWPDDEQWSRFVERTTKRGIPRLEKLLGIPWFNNDQLTITETVAPYLYGYAGWYSSDDNTIEIGDELDAEVVLHEISHIWFNDELFDNRWLNEGFAQTYANLALASSGQDARQPDKPGTNAPGKQPLLEWGTPSLRDDEETTQAKEEYGYNASWFVINEITDEIGTKAMRDIFIATNNRELTFLGDPKAETYPGAVNWQRVLDLVELRGGSKRADDLFVKYVADKALRDDFRDRTKAHRAYDRLTKAGGKGDNAWSPPLSVRRALTIWDFDGASDDMQLSTSILQSRNATTETLAASRVALPDSFEDAYESATRKELDELVATAEQYREDAEAVADAFDDVEADHGIFDKIGLIGNDYESVFDDARTAFEAGDTDGAVDLAKDVQATIDDAGNVGQQRVGMAVGGLIVLLGLIWGLRRLLRRRKAGRARRAAATAAAATTTATTAEIGHPTAGSATSPVASWGSPITWAPPVRAAAPAPPAPPAPPGPPRTLTAGRCRCARQATPH